MSKYVTRVPDPVRTVTTYAEKMKLPAEWNPKTNTYKMEQYPVEKRMRNIVLRWYEIRDQVRAVVERGENWTSQPSGLQLRKLHTNPEEVEVWDWTTKRRRETYIDGFGRQRWRMKRERVPKDVLASGSQMRDWLDNGFRSEEFENLAERVPAALQHRPTWNDEDGDVEVGRMIGGWDDFYMGPVEVPSKPGVRVQIEMAFACGVEQKTIEQYGAWVNSLLGSMEAYGIDMVIDLWIPLDDLFVGDSGVRTNVLIRVKESNEVSDFTDWSVLFSPAGYRQIGFAAKCVAGDKIGKRVTGSYGMTIGGKTWNLIYEPDDALVQITVNQRAAGGEAIPFEKLTQLAVDSGLIPDPEKIEA
jgi:hypothetical protein